MSDWDQYEATLSAVLAAFPVRPLTTDETKALVECYYEGEWRDIVGRLALHGLIDVGYIWDRRYTRTAAGTQVVWMAEVAATAGRVEF